MFAGYEVFELRIYRSSYLILLYKIQFQVNWIRFPAGIEDLGIKFLSTNPSLKSESVCDIKNL